MDLVAVVVQVVLVAVVAIWLAGETAQPQGRIGFQRLSVPPQTRSVFVVAATAAFAGFAVMGLFTAVAPSFIARVIGIDNHAAAGAIVASASSGPQSSGISTIIKAHSQATHFWRSRAIRFSSSKARRLALMDCAKSPCRARCCR
mgnify:CR=1 FL=1